MHNMYNSVKQKYSNSNSMKKRFWVNKNSIVSSYRYHTDKAL